MGHMTTPEHKVKLSIRVTEADKRAIEALVLIIPTMDEVRSTLLRAALRLGLAEIAKDPAKVLTARTPEIPKDPKRPKP